jgi:hypothetical protein
MKMARLLTVFALAACALATMSSTAFAKFLVLLEGHKGPVKIHAQSTNDLFEAGGGKFKCHENHYYGTSALEGDETDLITVSPEYTKCESEAGAAKSTNAKVEDNGCTYTFHQIAEDVSVLCPKGAHIKLNSGILSCRVLVGEENNTELKKVEYVNKQEPEAKPPDVEAIANISSGITFTSENCAGVIEASGNTAKYKANALVQAQVDEGGKQVQVGIHVG